MYNNQIQYKKTRSYRIYERRSSFRKGKDSLSLNLLCESKQYCSTFIFRINLQTRRKFKKSDKYQNYPTSIKIQIIIQKIRYSYKFIDDNILINLTINFHFKIVNDTINLPNLYQKIYQIKFLPQLFQEVFHSLQSIGKKDILIYLYMLGILLGFLDILDQIPINLNALVLKYLCQAYQHYIQIKIFLYDNNFINYYIINNSRLILIYNQQLILKNTQNIYSFYIIQLSSFLLFNQKGKKNFIVKHGIKKQEYNILKFLF
ncbi:unnamed protein product [Paramecium sonneborni]|uniref:Transmembrane protein n=1 Tax=Paramecium sonneborni TaxID=65129 RepID=A0A8S1MRP2_9CILI|nr:unnamed protein product [Paramecium sonneborni]